VAIGQQNGFRTDREVDTTDAKPPLPLARVGDCATGAARVIASADHIGNAMKKKVNDMGFLLWLLILFVIFAVAGWGWRFARGRR